MKIQTKRIYTAPSNQDGTRILIDRVWPRGVSKASAQIDFWAKSLAPSTALRKWYQHDIDKWDEFRSRYHKELDNNDAAFGELRPYLDGETVTIVYAAKETTYNNAEAFREYLLRKKN